MSPGIGCGEIYDKAGALLYETCEHEEKRVPDGHAGQAPEYGRLNVSAGTRYAGACPEEARVRAGESQEGGDGAAPARGQEDTAGGECVDRPRAHLHGPGNLRRTLVHPIFTRSALTFDAVFLT